MTADDLLKLLGRQVRTLREGRGWSQEELARRCGRHFTYIGRIERGTQNVTVEVLHEIASALGTTPGALLSMGQSPLLEQWKVTASDIVDAVGSGFRAQVDVKGNRTSNWTFLHIAAKHLERRPSDPNFLVIMQKVPPSAEGYWRSSVMDGIKDSTL